MFKMIKHIKALVSVNSLFYGPFSKQWCLDLIWTRLLSGDPQNLIYFNTNVWFSSTEGRRLALADHLTDAFPPVIVLGDAAALVTICNDKDRRDAAAHNYFSLPAFT